MWLLGVASLNQHIKFSEGNYSATAAVSWRTSRREVITVLSMENRRPRREPGNLAILNILRRVIIVWFFVRSRRRTKKKKKKKSGQEWRWMCVCMCVCAPGQCVCVSLSRHRHLWPPFLRPFARRAVCPSSANKAHSHAEAMHSSTSPCRNYIWFGPPASYAAHLPVAHNLWLSCGGQLEAHVSRPPGPLV